jgi:ribosome-associated protein
MDPINKLEMKKVKIAREPVELYKILKFEGLVSSGGEAKSVIATCKVKVNGVVETRKRRKMMSGEIIEYENKQYQLLLKPEVKPEVD